MRLRIRTARSLFPKSTVALYNQRMRTNSSAALEGYRRASRLGLYDDVSHLIPVLYLKGDGSSAVEEVEAQLRAAATPVPAVAAESRASVASSESHPPAVRAACVGTGEAREQLSAVEGICLHATQGMLDNVRSAQSARQILLDQYDELDEYLDESSPRSAPQQRDGGGRGGCWRDDGRGRAGLDGRGRGGQNQSEHRRSRSPPYDRDRHDRGGDSHRSRHDERGGRSGERDGGDRRGERGGGERWRDERGRHSQHGSMGGINASDPSEVARREARAAKFGPAK